MINEYKEDKSLGNPFNTPDDHLVWKYGFFLILLGGLWITNFI